MGNGNVIATKRGRPASLGRPFEKGNPGGPGRPVGEAKLKSRVLQEFRDGMTLTGKSKDAFLGRYLKSFFDAAEDSSTWQAQYLARVVISPDILEDVDAWMDRGETRERNFLSYTIHKRATDVQREILFTERKALFLMAGRRAGKTEGLRHWFADAMVQKSGARCLYIGLTITRAMALLWQPMLDMLSDLGIAVKEQNRTEGRIVTESGCLMAFGGNATKDEREKHRGANWDRVAIDEAQSQKDLLYLIESILTPTLLDTKGQLAVCGTGPRVRGTYWEALFLGAWADGRPLYPDAYRRNWNLGENPHIPDYEKALEGIRAEKNLKENDSLFVREYLGRIAYDDDALVLRLGDGNAFTDDALSGWIRSQPVTDVRFTAGLDFGFTDSDAFEIVCYSKSKPERFIVYEYKKNRIGTAELAAEIRKGLEYVRTSPLFATVTEKDVPIYADTGGNAITPYDLATQYSLPIQTAYKQQKEMAYELLQDECRRGVFKARRDGPFWEECLKTIYARDEQDNLTREIDDATFHPDAIPAVTYGMRPVWLFNREGQG